MRTEPNTQTLSPAEIDEALLTLQGPLHLLGMACRQLADADRERAESPTGGGPTALERDLARNIRAAALKIAEKPRALLNAIASGALDALDGEARVDGTRPSLALAVALRNIARFCERTIPDCLPMPGEPDDDFPMPSMLPTAVDELAPALRTVRDAARLYHELRRRREDAPPFHAPPATSQGDPADDLSKVGDAPSNRFEEAAWFSTMFGISSNTLNAWKRRGHVRSEPHPTKAGKLVYSLDDAKAFNPEIRAYFEKP